MKSTAKPVKRILSKARLYLVTPVEPRAGPLRDFLPRVLDAGVDVVQLREKTMEAGSLMPYCEVVRRCTEQYEALFIVNDRVDLAKAAGADGVHLGQSDLPVSEARRQMGPEAIIGLSTHTAEEISDSSSSGADYIGVGPVHATPTKIGRPAVGLDLVSFAARNCGLPFFAIGGLNPSTLPAVIQAGASRAAVLRALTEASDPPAVAREIKSMLLNATAPGREAGTSRLL